MKILFDTNVLLDAMLGREPFLEDAVQIACAIELELEGIVTRDMNGFAGSPIPVFSPQELRSRCDLAEG